MTISLVFGFDPEKTAVYALKPIKKGSVILQEEVRERVVSPSMFSGGWLPLSFIVGATAKFDIFEGQFISKNDLTWPIPGTPVKWVRRTRIVKAVKDIASGTIIRSDQLQVLIVKPFDADPKMVGVSSMVVGKVATRAIRRGQIITTDSVICLQEEQAIAKCIKFRSVLSGICLQQSTVWVKERHEQHRSSSQA